MNVGIWDRRSEFYLNINNNFNNYIIIILIIIINIFLLVFFIDRVMFIICGCFGEINDDDNENVKWRLPRSV